MDLEVLERHAEWIRERPGQLRAELDAFATDANQFRWTGNRAAHFRRMIEIDLLPAVSPIETAFLVVADLLNEQGDQQRKASEAIVLPTPDALRSPVQP